MRPRLPDRAQKRDTLRVSAHTCPGWTCRGRVPQKGRHARDGREGAPQPERRLRGARSVVPYTKRRRRGGRSGGSLPHRRRRGGRSGLSCGRGGGAGVDRGERFEDGGFAGVERRIFGEVAASRASRRGDLVRFVASSERGRRGLRHQKGVFTSASKIPLRPPTACTRAARPAASPASSAPSGPRRTPPSSARRPRESP